MPGMTLFGDRNAPAPSPSTAEDAALEYFINRSIAGDWTPRPRVEGWRPDQRERFEAELARLEAQRQADMDHAAELVARRGA
jgi:hypothetical protein